MAECTILFKYKGRALLRMKLKATPVEEQTKLISAIAYVLAQVSQSFGLKVMFEKEKMSM